MNSESVQPRPPLPTLLRLAIFCGAIPLLTGTVIYFAWRITHWPWLMQAGLYTIVFGLAAFVVGAIAYLIHCFQVARAPRSQPRKLWQSELLAVGLLIGNFPAAMIYAGSAIAIITRYTVRVQNDSHLPIDSFIVTSAEIETELGPVPAGKTVQRHLHFSHDGALDFRATQQDTHFEGQLESYVTGLWGGDKTVRVIQPGRYEILTNAAF